MVNIMENELIDTITQRDQQMRALLEMISDGLAIRDQYGRISCISRRLAEILSYRTDELTDKPLNKIVHHEDRKVVEQFGKMGIGEMTEPVCFTFRAITKNNTIKWLQVRASPIDWRNRPAMLCFINDISEIRLPGMQSEKCREIFNAFFDLNPIWTTLMTVEDGRIIMANPAFFDSSGYSRENVIGRTDVEIGLWPDPKDRSAIIRIITKKGRLKSFPVKFRLNNGEIHPFLYSALLIEFDGTECALGTCMAVSQQKFLEEVLIDKEKLISEQARRIQDFSAALKVLTSHHESENNNQHKKLRTSLKKSILPYLEKVKSANPDPASRIYLSIIESNLNDLLVALPRSGGYQMQELTITENRVADLIQHGKTSKEIAVMLNVSTAAIAFHRNNIRKKLGLSNKKIALSSHLANISK